MDDRNRTLTTYVGDMHALEEHMLEAFETQLKLTQDTPDAHAVVQQLVTSTRNHITALEQRVAALGHTEKTFTDTVKTAVAGLFGLAAGAIDAVRPQQVSKALRDSYTATNHAIIAYIMLQTTGIALSDQETANLAERHLADCVANAQAIASIMPALVVKDLSDDVGSVATGTVDRVINNQKLSHLYRNLNSASAGS
jgi:ferritin-like metal-binding protein YciE